MGQIEIITANTAAALAARLCRVQVVSAYPITPQTPVTEELAEMVENGSLKAEYITVESEHSALASVVAASQVGARVFTATSANGLLYMHEMLHWAAGSRVPIVMACVNRGVGAPWTILNDQQDTIAQRDTGWIQMYCRNSQEVLDTVLQAYMIAEQSQIPVMVCYDGFILSHTSTPVDVPSQEEVDMFLPPLKDGSKIDGQTLMNVNPLILSDPRPDANGVLMPGYMEFRYRLQQDIVNSFGTFELADKEFLRIFGRNWGNSVWSYRMEDAEHAIVSMGSLASECTVAADQLRNDGIKAGVVGVRVYRPFPSLQIAELLSRVRTATFFEKDVSYGYQGALAMDAKAAMYDSKSRPEISSYVVGLGGRDVRPEQLAKATLECAKGHSQHCWLDVRN
ncbi:MAG: transketolase C-terminal domain-containing protein [Desulfomonilaceae bacterium]